MKKHYVLDTNILIHDPDAIFKFEDNYVYIPGVSIEQNIGAHSPSSTK